MVGGTATRPGVRPGPVSTGGVPAGGEPDAAERRRGRFSPVAASFGRCARATPQAPSRSLASSLLAPCVRRPACRPPRRGTGVCGSGRAGRRATRTAGVALLHSVTSREGATTQGPIAVGTVINWMGRALLSSVLGVVRQPSGWTSRPCSATRASAPPRLTPTSGRRGWSRWWQGRESKRCGE